MAARRHKNPSAVKRSAEKARKASPKGTKPVSSARLQDMIAEATADAHDDQEAAVGFLSMLEENIAFPFETVVLGVPVTVEGLKETSRDIAAVVARGGARQAIPIEELPLPSPPPAGSEWIEAYRIWARLV